jgi:hypothetical protein
MFGSWIVSLGRMGIKSIGMELLQSQGVVFSLSGCASCGIEGSSAMP